MREKSGRARKREDESPSVGGGRKSARRKKDEETAGGRAEGYAVERWWIEEGRGRVGSGVEGLPGWREAGGGGGGGEGGR